MSDRPKRKSSLARENGRLRKRVAALEAERRDLERAEQALAQYWALLDAILSGTDDLYGLKGTDYTYQAANHAFCRFAGVPEAELRGRGDYELFPHPLAEILHRADVQVIQGGRHHVADVELPLPQRPIWARIQKAPVLDAAGQCVGILCVIRDQTLLRRYERQQAVLLHSGRDAYLCTDRDGAIVDVNCAYCHLSGHSREALVGKNLRDLELMATPAALAARLDTVERDGWATHHAVHRSKDNRILDVEANIVFSPEDRGRFHHYFRQGPRHVEELHTPPTGETETPSEANSAPPAMARPATPHRRVINLNDVVVLAISREIDKIPPGVSLRKDLAPDLKNTVANQSQIIQIIINLVTNAVEAMGGRGHLRIVTRNVDLSREWLGSNPRLGAGPYALLAVIDTGRGIGPALRPKVFEPFITTKFKGRGMGLASVARNVEEHQGIVTLKSEEGQGSTFNVYLPATDAPVDHRDRTPLIPSGTETILFVDHEDRVLEEGRAILERLAYRVIAAGTMAEAMKLVAGHHPPVDAVILDTSARGSTLGTFIKRVRAINPRIKLILSGDGGLDAVVQDLLDAGAHGFVHRPFRPDILAPKVRQTLDT